MKPLAGGREPVDHRPDRPSWDCLTCEKPWPCDPARERLAADHRNARASLAILLWGYFEEYTLRGGGASDPEGYERFIAWSRRDRPLRSEQTPTKFGAAGNRTEPRGREEERP